MISAVSFSQGFVSSIITVEARYITANASPQVQFALPEMVTGRRLTKLSMSYRGEACCSNAYDSLDNHMYENLRQISSKAIQCSHY